MDRYLAGFLYRGSPTDALANALVKADLSGRLGEFSVRARDFVVAWDRDPHPHGRFAVPPAPPVLLLSRWHRLQLRRTHPSLAAVIVIHRQRNALMGIIDLRFGSVPQE